MTVIRQEDFIQSIADAFQFISYYHPLDYIQALVEHSRRSPDYAREQSPAAKDAIAQILTNSRMSAEGRRPICQDTGIATVFLKVGMHVQWKSSMSVTDMVNEGVRQAYTFKDNVLRASIQSDPAGRRLNTKDNTPAVIHYEIVEGDQVEVICAAKGGGSEAKACYDQPKRLDCGLGFKNSSDYGGRMVPAGNPWNRHWRHPRKGCPHGQGVPHAAR